MSADCTSKAPGHRDNAMMTNCMGGTNECCEWREETDVAINSTDKLKMFTAKSCLIYVVSSTLQNNHSNKKNINENSQNIEEVVLAKGDNPSSHRYWRKQDKHVLKEIKDFTRLSVLIPIGEKFSATKKRHIAIISKIVDSCIDINDTTRTHQRTPHINMTAVWQWMWCIF